MKTPANIEKLSQYEIQPIRCENEVGLKCDSDKLSIYTFAYLYSQLIKLSLINCIHISLGIGPAASAQYDCLKPNTKANMKTVN